jgi:topoisomerase IA-like protein
VRAKNNLSTASKDKALAYHFGARIVGSDPNSGKEIWAPHVMWEPDYVDVTATQAMQAAADNRSPAQLRPRKASCWSFWQMVHWTENKSRKLPRPT